MRKRTVLITGASKGIGLATATTLAAEGHEIIGIARNEPENFPGEFYSLDLSDIELIPDFLLEIIQHKKIDSIINNVGITTSNTIEECSLEELNTILDLNVNTTFLIVKTLLTILKRHPNARIINISSRAALGLPNRCAYTAAKASVIGLTRSLAIDLAQYNINVNAVAPGPIDTELYRINNNIDENKLQKIVKNIPLKRIGKPDDIANAISFLLSDKSSFITGQVLYVCGGLSIGSQTL